jgi:hypothetical protein
MPGIGEALVGRPMPENLIPAKPGEVRNPKGINQYSYRRDFEDAIQRLLKGQWKFRRELIEDKEGQKVPCLICGLKNCDIYVGEQQYAHGACVDGLDGMSRGEAIAYVTVRRAMQGDEKLLPVVLDRLWPRVSKHEIDLPGIDPSGLADELAAAAKRKRSNGHDLEADAGSDGGGL